MVRHKTRWLLLKVEDEGGEQEEGEGEEAPAASLLSKRDVSRAIRDNFEALFGLPGAAASFDVHVRFWDASQTKLLLLRAPRDVAGPVRASLPFVATVAARRVAVLALSAHGSARTAKLAAIRRVRAHYRERILRLRRRADAATNKARAEASRLCAALENRLLTLQAIDF